MNDKLMTLLVIVIIVAGVYALINYRNTPITEIPFWVWVLLGK